MRFLADAGLSPATVDFLVKLGHEAAHVRTLGMLFSRNDLQISNRVR